MMMLNGIIGLWQSLRAWPTSRRFFSRVSTCTGPRGIQLPMITQLPSYQGEGRIAFPRSTRILGGRPWEKNLGKVPKGCLFNDSESKFRTNLQKEDICLVKQWYE